MIAKYNTPVLSFLQSFVKTASIIAISVGFVVLTGWFFNIAILKSILPNAATMKFNTALCFLLAGLSLWFLENEDRLPREKRSGQFFAGLVVSIGFLTIIEYLFDWDFGIDHILVKDLATLPANFPGRMSQITAICFTLSGISLLLIGSKISQYFSVGVLTLALVALIGYLFDYQSLYNLAGYGSVALHTAFTFLILSLGILAARPSLGIMSLFVSTFPGGKAVRFFLPGVVALIIVLGWLVKRFEHFGFFDANNESVVLIVLFILILSPLIYFYAGQINNAEEEIIRLNRLYATLSQVNQTIVHVSDGDALFRSICDVAVKFGKFSLAWVGLLDKESGEIMPVAANGLDIKKWPYPFINIWRKEAEDDLVAKAIHTSKVVISEDIQTDKRMQNFKNQFQEYGFHASAVVPFQLKGETIGVLCLISEDIGLFEVEDEIHLLEEMGADISFALDTIEIDQERKRAEEKTHRHVDYLTALRDVDQTIMATFGMSLSLNTLISKAVSLLNVDAAAILLVDFPLRLLKFSAGLGFRTNAIETATVRIGEGYAGRAVLERQLVQIPNLVEEPGDRLLSVVLKDEMFVSYYGVPLIVKGKVTGVLELFHRSIVERDQEWLDFLNALAGQAAIAIESAQLFNDLQRSNKELVLAYDGTIEGWSRAMDLRDEETEGHTKRVTSITLELAEKMGIDEAEMLYIRRGALLHDIGKLGVPDAILRKPGELTADEWKIMRKHPIFAYEMLSSIAYLKPALDIPYCHHEKWDGTGYPRGLEGEQIPLIARIFAVVDVYDALSSDRPYRKAWPREKILEYIKSLSGIHFDPQVVEVCLNSGLF